MRIKKPRGPDREKDTALVNLIAAKELVYYMGPSIADVASLTGVTKTAAYKRLGRLVREGTLELTTNGYILSDRVRSQLRENNSFAHRQEPYDSKYARYVQRYKKKNPPGK